MFSRVLIANRGEVAVRVIRTLHDLGIEAVTIYSTADADSLHVRMADRAVCVGPPPANQSYLNIASVVAAGETTRCDAVHPGWGFLAENAAFVRACEDNDLVFIGPSAETMEQMGDKVEAKAAMAGAGMPLIPGTEHAVDVDGARSAADELGYPVLLKASAGGGGRGMRLVESPEQLEDVFQGAVGRGELRIRGWQPLRREGACPGAPRGDPGPGRRAGRRAHARRARVLHPAPASEVDRGVALAGAFARAARRDGVVGRARVPAARLQRTPGRSNSCSARREASTSWS